jgi:serine/threonine-protein kinase
MQVAGRAGWLLSLGLVAVGCTGVVTGGGGDERGGDPRAPGGAYFPNGSVFYQDVSGAALRAGSDATIAYLDAAGGWGGGELSIDFGLEVLAADDGAPMREFETTGDYYEPDCDHVAVPIPAGGALEGEDGYACEQGGDCHLIVAHEPSGTLYEMWRADLEGEAFYGGCLAVWDMERVYGPDGRGLDCTSADAAGLPIAPLLFSADEVAGGEIDHAIRFILPNDRIRGGVYAAPATHSTEAADGGEDAPPFGAHLRLRADYATDELSAGAQVVARAMQRYGIILADGGTIALTAQSDRFTASKWDGLLDPDGLASIPVTAFEVVDSGAILEYGGDCQREP